MCISLRDTSFYFSIFVLPTLFCFLFSFFPPSVVVIPSDTHKYVHRPATPKTDVCLPLTLVPHGSHHHRNILPTHTITPSPCPKATGSTPQHSPSLIPIKAPASSGPHLRKPALSYLPKGSDLAPRQSKFPTSPQSPPHNFICTMHPRNKAFHHTATNDLLHYATTGCPVDCGKDWTVTEMQAAVDKGPHSSALDPIAITAL